MRLGIFAKTFAGTDPQRVLAAVRAAGYAAVQYNMVCSGLQSMPDEIAAAVAREVATCAKEQRVALVAVSGTYNMIHPDPTVRAAGHRRLEVLAGACRDLGTGLVTLCTGTRHPTDMWREHPDNESAEAWRDLLASMEVAIEIAERHGVDLGIEPELANVVNSARRARQLIDTLGSVRLRVVLDPANLFEVISLEAQRSTVARATDLLADRISLAHAKDRLADGTFARAGAGVLDYPHYLGCLVRAGFDGTLVTHGLDEQDAPVVASFLARTCKEVGARLETST